mgnify:CR=1 FL=1
MLGPTLATIAALACSFTWGGLQALLIAVLLAVMEVSLSFDNAVVNAAVLRRMSPRWQRAFLTWGILVAVFGMRLLFPILIVAVATDLGMLDVARLALNAPDEYSVHLSAAHTGIAAFGGLFLLMVFLHFVCDEAKDTHWIGWAERRLVALGRMEAVEVALALAVVLAAQALVPESERFTVLLAGVSGVATYVGVKGLAGLCGDGRGSATVLAGKAGVGAFLYLEVLDASFSLDGVIGAFAMSGDVVVIMTGLAIGALFVRTLTVQLVRRGTLEEFIYLEHGAHWGIGALAAIMLASLWFHVPEIVTGLIGVGLILSSLASSVRHRRTAVAP